MLLPFIVLILVGKSLKLCSVKKIKTFTVKHNANKQTWMITMAFIVFNQPSPELNAGSDIQTRIQNGRCIRVLHQSRYNYNVFDVLGVVLHVTYIQCLAPKDYRLWLPLSVRKPQMLSVDRCSIHS
jgi:hypothetical protein